MSKFSYDADTDDAKAMTVPRRFLRKTAELKIKASTLLI